jgi:hypothetical protein
MEEMGVPSSQALLTFMVVMEVECNPHQSYPRNNPPKEQQKYFKMTSKDSEVLSIVGGLKENEKVLNIFAVNEFGTTFPKTLAFVDGRLQLVDKQEENTK